jgi:hypothetical protein
MISSILGNSSGRWRLHGIPGFSTIHDVCLLFHPRRKRVCGRNKDDKFNTGFYAVAFRGISTFFCPHA